MDCSPQFADIEKGVCNCLVCWGIETFGCFSILENFNSVMNCLDRFFKDHCGIDRLRIRRHLSTKHSDEFSILLDTSGEEAGKSTMAWPVRLPVNHINLIRFLQCSFKGFT
eukprot:TRINITY_DN10378_c0_g1_i8.p2 TRINITY_DN10378_c0_g1~~TRINITY_DN10378_c0_g1_i8.p2  ORF type:complete len:111 (-),score=13.56 TRINITY_DN10378_c0_g1_i8:91-423(-)